MLITQSTDAKFDKIIQKWSTEIEMILISMMKFKIKSFFKLTNH